ncbi:hypothetical protein [Tunturiibacter psychrotolerans]|jgi:hypothetical protein|uniref:hypothetical protein n=1 Tax=Tunturiibacter psychrotolerans TaxID=3069686 RepID=UPI003D1BB4D1
MIPPDFWLISFVDGAKRTQLERGRPGVAVTSASFRFGQRVRVDLCEGFQEMFRIQTACYKLRSIPHHHQENLFAVFIDTRNLVEIDDTILCWQATLTDSPIFCQVL